RTRRRAGGGGGKNKDAEGGTDHFAASVAGYHAGGAAPVGNRVERSGCDKWLPAHAGVAPWEGRRLEHVRVRSDQRERQTRPAPSSLAGGRVGRGRTLGKLADGEA